MNTNIFDGTQKLIGKGAQADVVLYQGYAYKIYRPAYPTEWIAFEKSQQNEVNKAGLSPVRYYDTEDDHIVKMDYVEGETLENRAKIFAPFAALKGFEEAIEDTSINYQKHLQ